MIETILKYMENKSTKSGVIYINPESEEKISEESVFVHQDITDNEPIPEYDQESNRLSQGQERIYAESYTGTKPALPIDQNWVVKDPKDGGHSFLFWLVVPFIVIWLTVGYFIGFVKEHPGWSKTGYAQESGEQIKPFTKDYSPIVISSDTPYITLWFDDAWLSQYMVAYPLLKQYGFPGTIAVSTDSVESPSYVNWAQLRILEGNGWEITNHGSLHDCTMQNWERTKISDELKNSTLLLWKNKLTSDIFVTPCGVDSQTLREEARKSFIGYRTVNPGYNTTNSLDPYQLKVKNTDSNTTISDIKSWIDYAKESNSWLILVFHKVGETTSVPGSEEFNIGKDDFASILEHIYKEGIQVIVP